MVLLLNIMRTAVISYALEDIKNVKRINDKSVGSCYTCKSTAVPQMLEEMGDDYWGANFNT